MQPNANLTAQDIRDARARSIETGEVIQLSNGDRAVSFHRDLTVFGYDHGGKFAVSYCKPSRGYKTANPAIRWMLV
jgi:hypothetical protein